MLDTCVQGIVHGGATVQGDTRAIRWASWRRRLVVVRKHAYFEQLAMLRCAEHMQMGRSCLSIRGRCLMELVQRAM